jgi:hypothetical protein
MVRALEKVKTEVKFAEPRPYAAPEAAMNKLLEIASTVEPVQLLVRRPIHCA